MFYHCATQPTHVHYRWHILTSLWLVRGRLNWWCCRWTGWTDVTGNVAVQVLRLATWRQWTQRCLTGWWWWSTSRTGQRPSTGAKQLRLCKWHFSEPNYQLFSPPINKGHWLLSKQSRHGWLGLGDPPAHVVLPTGWCHQCNDSSWLSALRFTVHLEIHRVLPHHNLCQDVE